jgi:Cu/Ag efflux pump CusA
MRNGNQDASAGRITATDREMVGKTAGKFHSLDDIRGILLPTNSGARIPLSEVAVVRDTSAQQRSWGRLDGVPAVRIQMRKQPEANTVEVADGVRARLAQLQTSSFVPKDVKYVVTYDQSGFIRDSINSVKEAALIGAALAALVVLLFLRSFRKTLIVGLSIPLAVLATFIAMGVGDLTLNVMSLGGIALGMGVLLDNAIVMLENIYRRRMKDGLDPEEGAHVGAAEVITHAGELGVAVVLVHEDHRQLQHGREVQRLRDGALVRRPIADEREGDAAGAERLLRERGPDRDRWRGTDDRVPGRRPSDQHRPDPGGDDSSPTGQRSFRLPDICY